MEAILWQDWLTIRGTSYGTTQSENAYLDVSDFEGLTIFLDVREVGANATITFQTAPSKQDSAFVSLFSAVSVAAGNAALTYRLPGTYALVPPLNWLRWVTAFEMTFRIWVAGYAYGPRDEGEQG